MPLATEHYRALLEEVDLKKISSAEDAADALRKLLADTQQLTLSQLEDSVSRQLGSILFSHEAGLISALSTVDPPEVRLSKNKGFPLHYVFFLTSLIVSAVGATVSWKSGNALEAVFFISAAILSALASLWPRKKPNVQVTQRVNADSLFRLGERRMEALDRDMEAFLRLPTVDDDADEGVLRLISKAVALKREDPDSVPDELMTSITALTLSRGYTFLEYSGEEDAYFDIMPTKRATRTIVPAVLKGDRLVARGMAIVQMEQTAEEAIG